MDQTELLWALLTTGEISSLSNEWTDGLKKLDLEQIDWSSRNDNGLTILVQSVIILLRNESCEEEMLEIIEKFIRSGASISQTCTDEAESTFNFSRPDDEEEGEECEVSVEPAGLSAIAYVQAWAQELGNAEAAFDQKVQRLGKVLNRFAGGGLKKGHDARVPVHDAIIELWEKYLAASATHDLTIDTADGLVTAHAQMLKGASAVVAAMLESPMQEGQCQRIQVKDVPKGAVSLVQNRFKKAAMTAAAYHLTEEEQKELRRTFEKLDTDGDGFMTLQDLHRGLSDLPQMRGLNLAQLMDDLDRNQDGRLEYTEFIAAAMDQRLHQNEALCWRAFKAFDRDDDDRITYPDLLHVLQDPDLQMEVPNCRSAWQYFARMDEDGDGLVSFEDFMRMLSTQNTPVSASLYTKATFGALSPTRHSVSTMLEEDTVSHEDSAEEVISTPGGDREAT
eukprot:g589.t1